MLSSLHRRGERQREGGWTRGRGGGGIEGWRDKMGLERRARGQMRKNRSAGIEKGKKRVLPEGGGGRGEEREKHRLKTEREGKKEMGGGGG